MSATIPPEHDEKQARIEAYSRCVANGRRIAFMPRLDIPLFLPRRGNGIFFVRESVKPYSGYDENSFENAVRVNEDG